MGMWERREEKGAGDRASTPVGRGWVTIVPPVRACVWTSVSATGSGDSALLVRLALLCFRC